MKGGAQVNFSHKPVLLKEAIEVLDIKPNGIYVDATAGGGGHSLEIVKKLQNGKLIAIDRDPDAIAVLRDRFSNNENVIIIRDNYRNIKQILAFAGFSKVDGIIADLGVSSYQLDTAERGFSFHSEAPLDMRMEKNGLTAADVVNKYTERELSDIIFKYGEERFARSIARNIVKARVKKPVETTIELADIIKISIPARARREGGHPARRTFQALRIEVNNELEMLPLALDDMFDSLNKNATLAVITFHSLEDRIVKKCFNAFCEGCTCPKDFPICVCNKVPRAEFKIKSQVPSSDEENENPRSRSARLRAVKVL